MDIMKTDVNLDIRQSAEIRNQHAINFKTSLAITQCTVLMIMASGLVDMTTFARKFSKKPKEQRSTRLRKCHLWCLADNRVQLTSSSPNGLTAGRWPLTSVWCLQRRRRSFIKPLTHLRLPSPRGKQPKIEHTLIAAKPKESSSNHSLSKRLEAGIKRLSTSSRKSRLKVHDDGALRTLSPSNNSFSVFQSNFKEETLRFILMPPHCHLFILLFPCLFSFCNI